MRRKLSARSTQEAMHDTLVKSVSLAAEKVMTRAMTTILRKVTVWTQESVAEENVWDAVFDGGIRPVAKHKNLDRFITESSLMRGEE